MNLERLNSAISSASSSLLKTDISTDWPDIRDDSDVGLYLSNCVTEDGFDASGIGFLGCSSLVDENAEGVVPGGKIRRFGLVATAISVSGNAVVFSVNSGKVFWADHSFFSLDENVSYTDEQGNWQYAPWNQQNVELALLPLSDSIENFIVEALEGKWTTRLEELDLK